MSESADDLVRRLHHEAVERERANRPAPSPPARPPTTHYTQLPDCSPGSPLVTEWNFYRRIIGRLLAEGHEGKWLLIKNETVVGIWDTQEQADAVRYQHFLMQPVLQKQILVREPILRSGYIRLCRS